MLVIFTCRQKSKLKALRNAACGGHIEVMMKLLEAGAVVNPEDGLVRRVDTYCCV